MLLSNVNLDLGLSFRSFVEIRFLIYVLLLLLFGFQVFKTLIFIILL